MRGAFMVFPAAPAHRSARARTFPSSESLGCKTGKAGFPSGASKPRKVSLRRGGGASAPQASPTSGPAAVGCSRVLDGRVSVLVAFRVCNPHERPGRSMNS
jgi:hypothetical protein